MVGNERTRTPGIDDADPTELERAAREELQRRVDAAYARIVELLGAHGKAFGPGQVRRIMSRLGRGAK